MDWSYFTKGECCCIANDNVQIIIFATDGTTKTFFIVYIKKVQETSPVASESIARGLSLTWLVWRPCTVLPLGPSWKKEPIFAIISYSIFETPCMFWLKLSSLEKKLRKKWILIVPQQVLIQILNSSGVNLFTVKTWKMPKKPKPKQTSIC